MNILEVRDLAIPGVKVLRFGRFRDERGYFTEHFRHSQLEELYPALGLSKGASFVQANESRSRAGVIRGLHFQWQPYMGKLVRTLSGRMVDIALDVRLGSPTLGRAIFYDMPSLPERPWDEWIWLPPGLAHGNFYPQEAAIEYFCTGQYNPEAEDGISPLCPDIDFGLSDRALLAEFRDLVEKGPLLSAKDRESQSLSDWLGRSRSEVFRFEA
jgi:dTDP-4-dehydrorhamnose 3,5-epimerase